VSLVTEEKYREALPEFQAIMAAGDDEEYSSKAQYEMGRCLFFLGQYEKCIQVFTVLVQKYPKHPDMKDALFFIAKSNQERGEFSVASGLYRKLLSMTSEADSLHRKVASAMREIEGEGE
jgi:TolA-binding protein